MTATAEETARNIVQSFDHVLPKWAQDKLCDKFTAALLAYGAAERARAVENRDLHWRKIMMRLTPGGSEYCTPEEIHAFLRHELDSLREFKRQVYLERNSRALASAATGSEK